MASNNTELKHSNCCLKTCTNKDSLQMGCRVEVKTFVLGKSKDFKINWSDDGQAVFHKQCWDSLRGIIEDNNEKEMLKEAVKSTEFFDDKSSIEEKAKCLANMLKMSKHAIAFTGAGISTAAGIGDFRGKGGKWTERDRKKVAPAKAKTSSSKGGRQYSSLRPTYTHEAMAKLVEMGVLKFIISQNVDGLHRLSGVPADKISELHGNVFIEKCEKCSTRFERSYVRRLHKSGEATTVPPKKCSTCKINHRTGGICDKKGCGGYLMNNIINFGDNLEDDVISIAKHHASSNDMVLCFGSSLSVTPACHFVEMGNPVQLAICNRQPTHFDDLSVSTGSRVYGDCDDLMRSIMKELLPPQDLNKWEQGRETRLVQYGLQRQTLS